MISRACVSLAVLVLCLAGCDQAASSDLGSAESALGKGRAGHSGWAHDDDDAISRKLCPRNSNVIEGTPGDDVLVGTSKRDCIFGHEGDDTIYALGGDDIVFGGPGNDRIFTGTGRDRVRGGEGNDHIDMSSGLGGMAWGDEGNDTIIGGPGHDMFFGGGDSDILMGGAGTDILRGEGCHDLLVGGGWVDVGRGGDGVDACRTEVALECEKKGHAASQTCESNDDCDAGERCASFVKFCVPEDAEECGTCIAVSDVDDTCDGVDDDCDGVVDDDFEEGETVCGLGACGATGTLTCDNGELVDSCEPSAPAASDASCDGVDDDCDGTIDEDFVGSVTSCGAGVCHATGVTSCVAGSLVDSCQPAAPSSASDTMCNGLDDDCDGLVDDDFQPVATSCGSGVCATTGMTSCVGGSVQDSCTVTCEGACEDGTDDDGDGMTDCGDSDCSALPACMTASIGSRCETNADCASLGADARCEIALPGGYCTVSCENGCPSGTACWLGYMCAVPCNPGDACANPDHVCGDFTAASLPPDPICHPTCTLTCPQGLACDPSMNLCL